MPCECISCGDCGGNGTLWENLDGNITKHRCDDLGDLISCHECRGTGVTEVCWECSEAMADEFEAGEAPPQEEK